MIKDELTWSGHMGTFFTEDGEVEVVDDYLFRPERVSNEFWMIAEELAQLNDYCVLSLQEVDAKCRDILKDIEDLELGKAEAHEKWQGFTSEALMQLEEERDIWRDTQNFLTRTSCLVLLLSFTERCLKYLCIRLGPNSTKKVKRIKDKSSIASYMCYLQETCEIPFEEPKEFQYIEQTAREIRNQFAHGDWDELRISGIEIHLKKAFTAVATLFSVIEDASWDSILKKKD